jgi:hypothetical protein
MTVTGGKARQQPAVVEMRVGQQGEIQPPQVTYVGLAISARRLASALEHAIVDQKPGAAPLDQQA